MALPSSNITTTLVGQTLGTSSRDVGTLCTHPNINKWSVPKPIRKQGVSLTTNELMVSGFGIVTEPTTGDVGVLDYLKPVGGANSPYRLGDFRGYNHGALPPRVNNRIIEYSMPVFGDVAGESASFRGDLVDIDFLKVLKNEGYQYIATYKDGVFLGASQILDSSTSLQTPTLTTNPQHVVAPCVEYKQSVNFFISRTNDDPLENGHAFVLNGIDLTFEVIEYFVLYGIEGTVLEVAQNNFDSWFMNYTHILTIGFRQDADYFKIYVNFPPNYLTQQMKDDMTFYWNHEMPYNGVNINHTSVDLLNSVGGLLNIPLTEATGNYLGYYTSPDDRIVFNNCFELTFSVDTSIPNFAWTSNKFNVGYLRLNLHKGI